eukprot:TRINITY_DN23250_c0_g1_i2.p1 TRINITY_DN23250_c0_g1~~TRINITY_DN23250_c0_g1_i2.p1  ORF type:complete len:148 (+),score=27.23 TRINITY_DN23250_c0_g1_i2:2-445(+)
MHISCLLFLFFFFQAEDGIRDRSPSRGLGDVYKRQVSTQSTWGTSIISTNKNNIIRFSETVAADNPCLFVQHFNYATMVVFAQLITYCIQQHAVILEQVADRSDLGICLRTDHKMNDIAGSYNNTFEATIKQHTEEKHIACRGEADC